MDPEQFKLFLEQQQAFFTQILDQFKANKSDSSTLSNINPFENYDSKHEKFSHYLERFENYYALKGITDKGKIAQLLCASIGSTHYNSLAAFLGPENPVCKLDYEDLVKSFKQLLMPIKSVLVSQHYFLNIYQKENQSISEFVADLQRDLVDCEFTAKCDCDNTISIADVFLRAQFVRGLRDDWLREQILQSNLTKFEDILSKAVALEASKIESREFTLCSSATPGSSSVSSQPHSSTNDINRISNFPRKTERYRSSSSKRQLDYKSLGIENLCLRCGRNNHKANDCRVDRNKLKCESCLRQGHVSKVCVTNLLKTSTIQHKLSTPVHNVEEDSPAPGVTYEINKIDNMQTSTTVIDLFEIVSDPDKYLVHVTLNGKSQRFEVDSGARFSLLAEDDYNRLNLGLLLEASNVNFRTYSGNIIQPKGKVCVNVAYKGKEILGELHIVPAGHSALLGRQWIRELGIELKQVYAEMKNSTPEININSISSTEDIFGKFAPIFEEKIGCVPGFTVSLQLRPNAKPIFTKEREVPYALRERVDKELDSLEANGIISPIPTSDWGSPLVVIPKADQGVRLCVDYKCGVNERLVKASHPIRRIDDILNSLRNSKYFCKLDLYKAFLHLKVDEDSSDIQTISTHRGTYRMHRLSFGIKTAPSEFNRILSQILKGLPKTEAYFDDIIVHGSTKEECIQNLITCLQRLSDFDLHLNKSKCSFFMEKVEYLGYVVEHNKISKSPIKIQAIQEMPRPSNTDDVRRFLGLVTYYARFIPNFSSISYPLRRLLKKGERWLWSANCEATFVKLKAELCSDRILVPFDPSLPLALTTDASSTGIGAVLSHITIEGEKPIAYASRSLNTSEMNYSQLDREALAIIFGVNHFYYYLFGKHFMLITDNEPLTRIFHHQKALPQMTSARLLRYASFLSGFDYSVQFKKGKDNENVDCLSRAPIQCPKMSADQLIGEEVNAIYAQKVFQISNDQITSLTIKNETQKDQCLNELVESLTNTSKDSEYTLLDGIIFRKNRILIPSSLRPKILQELHSTHMGITKMKQLARRYVYWPGIDRDIERLVRGCESCALTRSNPPKAPVHPWDPPENNWERIHIDYAGPVQNYNFLVCVDAKSKWAEIKMIRDTPTSTSTIELLESIFAVHGYPQEVVSDNATIFTSEEFYTYCKNSGMIQKFIAPGHPATNGLAERNVQTLKNKLTAASNDPGSIHHKVQNIMFRYRATPLACGLSPAELYLHRKIRIRLDAIFPYHHKTSKLIARPARSFQVGERVQVRFFINNKNVWQFGEIIKVLGKRHYDVQLDNGRRLKRHVNQLCSTLIQKPKQMISFGPTKSYNVPRVPAAAHPEPIRPIQEYQPRVPAVHLEPARPIQEYQPQLEPILPFVPPIRPVRNRRLPERFKDYTM